MPPIDTDVAPEPMGSDPIWVDRGIPFVRPAGRQFQTHMWLPQNYNRSSVYPVVEGDAVHVRFRFMVGLDYEPVEFRTYVLVEGRVAEVVVGGNRVSRVDLDASTGLGEVTLQIPPDQLQPGLNQVNPVTFYEIRHEGRSLLKITYGSVFSIANGSATPQNYVDDVDLEVGEFQPGEPTRTYRVYAADPEAGELYFGFHNRFRGPLDNPTNLRVRVQPSTPFAVCPGAVERQIIVAFRDGELVPMGDRERLMVSVGQGQQFVHRFDLEIWPEDELNHHYALVLLSGFGRPARADDGGVAPWASNVVPPLTEIQWLVENES